MKGVGGVSARLTFFLEEVLGGVDVVGAVFGWVGLIPTALGCAGFS